MPRFFGAPLSLAVWSLAACRGEPAPPRAELGELCGERGPALLLDLNFDQVLRPHMPPLRVGDRIYTMIARLAPGGGVSLFPQTVAPEVWTTGPCGESPRRVGEDITTIFTVERWPDVVLGCRSEAGEIVSLDPAGEAEPHVVFAGLGDEFSCGLRWTAHGLISVTPIDEELGALFLYPYPDDPRSQTAEPVMLLGGVRSTATSGTRSTIASFDDFVLAITPGYELARVDLEDRSATVEQTNALALAASPDGRHLLWQSATPTNDDPARVEGLVSLRDRDTGEDRPLVDAALGNTWFPFEQIDQGAFTLELSEASQRFTRVYRLPDLEAVDLGPGQRLMHVFADGRWLVGTLWPANYQLFDPERGTAAPLFRGKFQIERWLADGVDLLEVSPCCIEGEPTDEGAMWSVPIAGEPRRLARRATRYNVRVPDGPVVTALDLDDALRGTLVAVDPETEDELVIDELVLGSSLLSVPAFDPDVVVYSVSGGERPGVYIARIPARP